MSNPEWWRFALVVLTFLGGCGLIAGVIELTVRHIWEFRPGLYLLEYFGGVFAVTVLMMWVISKTFPDFLTR